MGFLSPPDGPDVASVCKRTGMSCGPETLNYCLGVLTELCEINLGRAPTQGNEGSDSSASKNLLLVWESGIIISGQFLVQQRLLDVVI